MNSLEEHVEVCILQLGDGNMTWTSGNGGIGNKGEGVGDKGE